MGQESRTDSTWPTYAGRLVPLHPDDQELDMATVEGLHAAQSRIETKLDHVLEGLDNLKHVDESQAGEIKAVRESAERENRELRDRVIVLEQRLEHEAKADELAKAEAWRAKIEQWVVRIGVAVGVAGTGAQAFF